MHSRICGKAGRADAATPGYVLGCRGGYSFPSSAKSLETAEKWTCQKNAWFSRTVLLLEQEPQIKLQILNKESECGMFICTDFIMFIILLPTLLHSILSLNTLVRSAGQIILLFYRGKHWHSERLNDLPPRPKAESEFEVRTQIFQFLVQCFLYYTIFHFSYSPGEVGRPTKFADDTKLKQG